MRWRAAALAVLLVAAVLALLVGRRRAAQSSQAPASGPEAARSSQSGRASLPTVPGAETPSGPRNRNPHWGQDDAVSDDPVATYIHVSRYPPNSRPLGPQNDDLLEPNKRHEDAHETRDGRLRYRFSADRFFIVGDERLETFLEVHGGPISITTSFIAVIDKARPFAEWERIPFRLDKVSETLYTAPVRAATLGLTQATQVGVYVAFEHGSSVPEKASFVFHYTPTKSVPARFTGEFRESLREGSLVIEAGVHVDQPGWYVIDCNLHDADGHPLAWTHHTGALAAGDSFVPLRFFGKVLRDAAAPSPYAIRQLRGERHVEGRDPEVDRMIPYDGRYATRAWALSDFSDAEWDDESRKSRIDRLRDAQASGPKRPIGSE